VGGYSLAGSPSLRLIIISCTAPTKSIVSEIEPKYLLGDFTGFCGINRQIDVKINLTPMFKSMELRSSSVEIFHEPMISVYFKTGEEQGTNQAF
jgi:hypothetical protein